jgi:hypothetical protein
LELKGDKNLLGEFIEFKGRHEDIQLLKNLKRSKVSRFIIQKSTLFGGFGKLYAPFIIAILFSSYYALLNLHFWSLSKVSFGSMFCKGLGWIK